MAVKQELRSSVCLGGRGAQLTGALTSWGKSSWARVGNVTFSPGRLRSRLACHFLLFSGAALRGVQAQILIVGIVPFGHGLKTQAV